jgi:hypothetical protein
MRRRNYRRYRLGDPDILTASQFERGSQEMDIPATTGQQELIFLGSMLAFIAGMAYLAKRIDSKSAAPVVASNP